MKTTLLRSIRTEARIRESMRRDLQTLRTALLATIGRGGSTIPFDQLVHFSIRGPMVDPTRTEDEGPGAFDWVTTATYVRLARAVGAEVYNFPER